MRSQTSIALLAMLALSAAAVAAEIPGERLRDAVERWSARGERLGLRPGLRVRDVIVHRTRTARACYEMRFDGGGFAVTDANDESGAVLAFSTEGELVESEGNPLWTLLCRHLDGAASVPRQANAAPRLSASAPAVSDLRVAPLLSSKWNQGSVSSGYCYNYYTPGHYPCGCVATAMAQVMRYHRWPQTATAAGTSYSCKTGATWKTVKAVKLKTKGGVYDWDGMPPVPGSGSTESNRQAIGRLTYDCGVTMRMEYAGDGSSAIGAFAYSPLKSYFGYKSAIAMLFPSDSATLGDAKFKNALLPGLDAKCPAILGVLKRSGGQDTNGHAIVADGYGYADGTCYVHLNFGWAGQSDAWYAIPDIGTSSGFNCIDDITYNIMPSAAGAIVSGHVTEDGTNLVGVTVRAIGVSTGDTVASAVTDGNGVYSVVLGQSTRYRLVASFGGDTLTNAVSTGSHASLTSPNLGTGTYTPPANGYSCANRWGNDFTFHADHPPAFSELEPADRDVFIHWGGEETAFAAGAEDPDGTGVSYEWTIDGDVFASGADATNFVVSATELADAGWHEVAVVASSGGLGSTNVWRLGVNREWWVDRENGVPGADADEGTPLDEIHSVFDNTLVDGDTVLVRPGVYEGFWCFGMAIDIIATDGPERTVISGGGRTPCFREYDPDTGTIGFDAYLEGFTLRDGVADGDSGAGVLGGYAVVNCVISNCTAAAFGGGAYQTLLCGCVLRGNSADYGGGAGRSDLYSCTVVGNVAVSENGGLDYDCSAANTIVSGNLLANGGESNWGAYYGYAPEFYCCRISPLSGKYAACGCIGDDPAFIDSARGDFRLKSTSPCIDAGNGEDFVVTSRDLAGEDRIQGEAIDMGAYEGGNLVETAAGGDVPCAVPFAWLDPYMSVLGFTPLAEPGEFAAYAPEDYEDAVRLLRTKRGGRTAPVWTDYVAGTDPTDPDSVLTLSIALTNGTPSFSWRPDLGSRRDYRLLGKAALDDESERWATTNATHRFFKLSVSLP